MTLLLVILFISGYILIALEHQTGISKSAIALLLGILLWTFIPHTDNEIINHLGDTAEILFYLLGAMTIVEWIDTHNGFTLITNHITTRNKRKLLWIIAFVIYDHYFYHVFCTRQLNHSHCHDHVTSPPS